MLEHRIHRIGSGNFMRETLEVVKVLLAMVETWWKRRLCGRGNGSRSSYGGGASGCNDLEVMMTTTEVVLVRAGEDTIVV